jgi:hypothetical protein
MKEQATAVGVNRNYKDTLFRKIFSEEEKLLALFNAVNQTEYEDVKELRVNTLDNAIYMNMKNDISFLIDCEIHLYEHQSTPNPNIPMRDLLYVSRSLQREIGGKSLYSSTLQKIPTPRFYMFYNGTAGTAGIKVVRCISKACG